MKRGEKINLSPFSLNRGAVSTLAAVEALQCFATNRYQAHWQAAGVEPRPPRNHSLVKVAGLIVCRQRPDTASGVMFMTLEDETGSINLVVWPKILERLRRPLLQGQLLLVQGTLQREEDVIHVIVGKARDCSDWLGGMEVRSRNFADGIRTTRVPAEGM